MRIDIAQLGRRLVPTALTIGFVAVFSSSYQASANVAPATASFQSLVDSNLVLLGPVEGVNLPESRIQVLGQWVVVPSTRTNVVVGELVAVYGVVDADGTYKVSDVSKLDSSSYVAGATKLFLKGVVTSIDSNAGTLHIGSYSVNYSGALHSLSADKLAIGEVATFTGLSFPHIESLIADNGAILDNPEGQVGGNAVIKPAGQVGGNAVVSIKGQVGGNAAIKPEGQVGGNAVIKPAGQVGGNAVVSIKGQVGGNAAVKPEGQVGGNAVIKPAGQVGGNAVIKPAGQVGGNAVVSIKGQVGGNVAVKPEGQVGGNAVIKPAGQVGGN
ncbi:MAG: hypothetical protein ACLPTF_02635 [Steroidobacteraceae bacterium]